MGESEPSFRRPPIKIGRDADLAVLQQLHKEATDICDQFISIKANNQVNIPFSMRTANESIMADWTKVLNRLEAQTGEDTKDEITLDSSVYSIFNTAQREVYALTSRDGYERWKKTPAFSELMKKLREDQSAAHRQRLGKDAKRLATYRAAAPSSSAGTQLIAGEFSCSGKFG